MVSRGSGIRNESPEARPRRRQAAAEEHDREARRSRADRASARARSGPRGRRSSSVRASVWRATSSSPTPRPARNSAWVVRPEVVEAGAGRGPLDRGQVDVGGQVLPADLRRGSAWTRWPVVGAQGAAAGRVVELRRRVAVVDEEEQGPRSSPAAAPATQGSIARQISAGWPRLEVDPLGRQAGREGRRRWAVRRSRLVRPPEPSSGHDTARGACRPVRPSTRWTGSASSSSLARIAPSIGSPSSASRTSPAPIPARRSRTCRRRSPAALGDAVADGVEERRARSAQAVEDPRGEGAGPGAVLANDEPRRPIERCQTSSSCAAIAQPKIGWPSGRGQEVEPLGRVRGGRSRSSRAPGRRAPAP